MVEEVGLLQATLDAIGESDTEIGGYFQTRLTAQMAPVTATPDTFFWDSSGLVFSIRQPTELVAGDWIRLEEDGRAFEITDISFNGGVPQWEITVALLGATTPETKIGIVGSATWATPNVTLDDTLVAIGMWIWADTDKQWFKIIGLSPTVALTENPGALTFPVGALASSYSVNPILSLVTTSISVETTWDWPASGKIVLDGQLYFYGDKTLDPPSLDQITYVDGGQVVVGLRQTHNADSVVTDVTKARNALDLVRQAILVDYASTEDLNALGRNFGVLRFPFLGSDDVFREIIKALAYNPRGTIFGIELALDAMLGSGNYVLYEDLVNFPCTVFVSLADSTVVTDEFVAKAYLSGHEVVDPTSTTEVEISTSVVDRGIVHGIRLLDENHLSDFRNQKPSADTIEEIDSVFDTVWAYAGGAAEGTYVTQFADEGVEFTHPSASTNFYSRNFRSELGSYCEIDMVLRVETGTILDVAKHQQWCLVLRDGAFEVGWGILENAPGYTIELVSGATAIGAAQVALDENIYYTVTLRKYGQSHVELWIDGKLRDTQLYAAFTATSPNRNLAFGIIDGSGPTTYAARVRQIGFYCQNTVEYWGAEYLGNAALSSLNQITDVTNVPFLITDIGKHLVVRGGTSLNAWGGLNNGEYRVLSFTSTSIVRVQGQNWSGGALVSSAGPLRITIDPTQQQLVYPRDLGKNLWLIDSAHGNSGAYRIEKLLNPGTLTDYANYDTPLEQSTYICEVIEPFPGFSFVSEVDIAWRLDPTFVVESGLDFEMSDIGVVSGTTLTLRTALPTVDSYVAVTYSEVLSAQVLANLSVQNEKTQTLPSALWSYYPFYLSDPFAFVRAYLDEVTAAGVIPEFILE